MQEVVQVDRFEMRDQATGETYCTWIENGEWVKVKGECEMLTSDVNINASTANGVGEATSTEATITDATSTQETTCVPNWQCSDWQPLPETVACGQTFTQTCNNWVDSNNCGTEEGKPSQGQEVTDTLCSS